MQQACMLMRGRQACNLQQNPNLLLLLLLLPSSPNHCGAVSLFCPSSHCSMRPDLIGEGYAAALAQLQDNVAPFDSRTAMSILEQELGAPPDAIFSYITPQPIASASLGQVRLCRQRFHSHRLHARDRGMGYGGI